MTSIRHPRIAAAALVVPLVFLSPAAWAQTPYTQAPYRQPLLVQQSATPDADALAEQMRQLAVNPSDVNAMVRAGELTLKLDDATAAAGFFARAERIDPNNPRIKAGKGTMLVQAGRPGEALQRFAEAEALRGDVRLFAADRGLAYDLIGEQERAQRDYRLALRNGPADETLRRYALSLGISGRRDEALLTIDPLLRRSDRGAWRARAFILAMNGDGGGAERIAASMMPGGLGQGLQPFFTLLPRLKPSDRAFAVHFGEVRTTPQRMADARMTPRLPVLSPEPGRPVAGAAVQVAQIAQPVRDDRRSRRDRKKKDKIVLATVTPPVPLPQPPAYQAPAVASGYAQSVASASPPPALNYTPPVPSYAPPVTLASNRVTISAVPTGRINAAPVVRSSSDPSRVASTVPSTSVSGVTPSTIVPGAVVTANTTPARAVPPSNAPQAMAARPVIIEATPGRVPAQFPTATTVSPTAPPTATAALPPVVVTSVPVTTAPAAVPAVVPAPVQVPVAATVLPAVPGPVRGEDSILAKIIANITVPGSELDVGPEPVAAAAGPASSAPTVIDDAQATLIAEQKAADRLANEKALADRRAADKRAADRKLAEAKKLAEAETPIQETPATVRKRGETVRQFEARKLAAEEAAAAVIVRKPGETKRQFDARKLAAKPADDEVPALTRKAGESVRQFEARKLAAAKKTGPDKKTAADRKEPKTAEAARIWVQVSGGANEGDLARAWDKVRKDAPVAMRGRAGWTTPLRATNRVLTGPFKTDGEARALVNALGKEGVSAFSFTSEAGQKVTRLAGK